MSDGGNSFNGGDAQDYGDEDDYGSEVDIVSEADAADGLEHQGVSKRGGKRVPDEDRITSRFMTKYERARVLGTRAL